MAYPSVDSAKFVNLLPMYSIATNMTWEDRGFAFTNLTEAIWKGRDGSWIRGAILAYDSFPAEMAIKTIRKGAYAPPHRDPCVDVSFARVNFQTDHPELKLDGKTLVVHLSRQHGFYYVRLPVLDEPGTPSNLVSVDSSGFRKRLLMPSKPKQYDLLTKVSVSADLDAKGVYVDAVNISPGFFVKNEPAEGDFKPYGPEVAYYTCNSDGGDCGTVVNSYLGHVGIHIGYVKVGSKYTNVYMPFHEVKSLRHERRKRSTREDSNVLVTTHLESGFPEARLYPRSEDRGSGPAAAGGSSRLSGSKIGGTVQKKTKTTPSKSSSKPIKEGVVGMSPAPSDYLGSTGKIGNDVVSNYVGTLVNPWGSEPVRLPDHVVTPTALARFFANRTYTIGSTATSAQGPNLLFALNTRMSLNSKTTVPAAEATTQLPVGGSPSTSRIYLSTPGNILTPVQWGGALAPDPKLKLLKYDTTAWQAGESAWGDDYGASQAGTIPYISSYRTLAAAMRVRIIGLPTSQFMTPGKIYFAQVRYNQDDLPLTEQDFVVLEQKGRASHVSADAVREAGSKTVFWTPDGSEKFLMTSNFLLAPGVVSPPTSSAMYRQFFDMPSAFAVGNAPAGIVPYVSRPFTDPATSATQGIVDDPDSANADSTSLLLIGYFGASDGVILEVDYANVIEYIPNKSAPAGIDTSIQLPSGPAMDAIFSSAAVAAQYRPVLIQSSGDKTVSGPVASSGGEASKVKSSIVQAGRRSVGSNIPENWFWDLIAKGDIGGGKIKWDFT